MLVVDKKKYNHCLFICVNVNIYFTISRILNAAKRLVVVNSRKICRGRRILLSNSVKIAGQLLEQHNGSIIHPKADEPHISSSYVSSTHRLSLVIFLSFASYPVIPAALESCLVISKPDLLYNCMYVVMVVWRSFHVYM